MSSLTSAPGTGEEERFYFQTAYATSPKRRQRRRPTPRFSRVNFYIYACVHRGVCDIAIRHVNVYKSVRERRKPTRARQQYRNLISGSFNFHTRRVLLFLRWKPQQVPSRAARTHSPRQFVTVFPCPSRGIFIAAAQWPRVNKYL